MIARVSRAISGKGQVSPPSEKRLYLTRLIVSIACIACACTPEGSAAAQGQAAAIQERPLKTDSRNAEPRTPPIRVEPKNEQPLKRVDNLDVSQLRNFLADKQFRPGGPEGGREVFEANGRWKAYRQAFVATFSEGSWKIRLGVHGKPELCTVEARRNKSTLAQPQILCRKIAVSIRDNKAVLDEPWPPNRKYMVSILPSRN